MTQVQQVVETIKKLGGLATLGKLNATMDFTSWNTKTPEASVRRIVQTSPLFVKIRPGLWGLKKLEDLIKRELNITTFNERTERKEEIEFSHSYFQGLLTEIGNLKNMTTFVPLQDKNKFYLKNQLKNIAKLSTIYHFPTPN